jgi:hypothetical protein
MACVVFVGTQKNKMAKGLALRGWPFEGQDNLNNGFQCETIQIWTSATCRNSSRVNCMCGSRDNVLQKSPGTQAIPPVLGSLYSDPSLAGVPTSALRDLL